MRSLDAAQRSGDVSQSGEEDIILKHTASLPVKRFLDIGAGDGKTFSNTYTLAQKGWGGVCVEPAPWNFDYLVKCYQERKDIFCVNAVVTATHTGLIDFYYTRGDHLSSTSLAHTRTWPNVEFRPITGVGVKLHDLLDYFDEDFSFVSIDTEGTTMELLDAYKSHDRWDAVRVICIEVENSRQREEVNFVKDFRQKEETANNVILAR